MTCRVVDIGSTKMLLFDEDISEPKVAARMKVLVWKDEESTADVAVEQGASVVNETETVANPCHMITTEAIASYTKLLGNDSYEETVRDLMCIREHGGPEPDPVTGVNAWTSAYEQLEQEGLQEALRRLQRDGNVTDDNIPIQTFAVSQMSSGSFSGIEKTRSMLGLPSKSNAVAMTMAMSDDPMDISNYEVPQEVLEVVGSLKDDIDKEFEKFSENFIPRPQELNAEAPDGLVSNAAIVQEGGAD